MTERTLIAGVGYFNQRDLSIGGHLVRTLLEEDWPDRVVVEELSYGPIAVIHRLNEADPPFERAVFVGAVRRDRMPGEVACYRWQGSLPPEDEVQARIGQALSGVVDLENLLIITTQFGALPADVVVVEVEPVDYAAGLELSLRMATELPRLARLVRMLAEKPETPPELALELTSAPSEAIH